MIEQKRYSGTITDPDRAPFPLTKGEVSERYFVQGLSMRDIGKEVGASYQRVARWMEYWELPRRSTTESRLLAFQRLGRERGPNWKGGKWFAPSSCTWFTYAPDHPKARHHGGVATHILVAEERIGRLLQTGEVVHHLDCDRHNNDELNLCVMTREQHGYLHSLLGTVGIKLLFIDPDTVYRLLADGQDRHLVACVYRDRMAELPKDLL